MARTWILCISASWPWPWRYDLESRSWHTLWSWTQLWEILSRSNMAVKSYGLDTHILLCVHFDIDLGGMTLGQGHDTPLGHGQQLCEILSRSNMAVRSYGPDTEFWYVCTVTLTLEVWPWVKNMTHPWAMDNNCVKYYSDPTWQWGVMARTWILGMCALWPWPWRYDLDQGHNTPLGHGQQWCEIISRSDKGVRSYCPDTMWTEGHRQTDGQGDSYIPSQTLFAGGITKFAGGIITITKTSISITPPALYYLVLS